jgi:hypothetical protein
VSSGTSYNGWPANSDKAAIGVESVDEFPGGAKTGDVSTVLGYVARQLNARVEPFVSGWGWGYTYKANVNNPSQLSCHASGTAIDWNAPDHPNGSSGTFTDAQVATIYQILAEAQGAVNWLEGYDEMHFEICVNATDLAYVAALLGDAAPPPTPLPEDLPMALIVKRANGTDYGWTDDLGFYLRIPSVDYYANLSAVIELPPHGQADPVDQALVDWYRGQVAAAGGRVFEPTQ